MGKDPATIKLIAVTKTYPVNTILDALQNGIEYIAESRVQECETKIPLLKNKYKEFHFIGHLQTNKIAKLLSLSPTLIHSVDKYSTAEKINQVLENTITDAINGVPTLRRQDILIEVNTSGEPQKNGISPDQLPELLQKISQLQHIKIKGLMTISQQTTDEQTIRQNFRLLKQLFDDIQKSSQSPNIEIQYLSMGMSDDFNIAIEEGSNMLRIGTAIFGQRSQVR